jgi:hypothetical protein
VPFSGKGKRVLLPHLILKNMEALKLDSDDSLSAHLVAQAAAGAMKDWIPIELNMRLQRSPKPRTTVTFRIPGFNPTTVTADWETMLNLQGLPLTLRGLTAFVGGDFENVLLWAGIYC